MKKHDETSREPQSGGYELAEEVTGLCRGTLYAMVHQRRIPHIRLSKRLVRFRRADLEVWMSDQFQGVRNAAPTKDGASCEEGQR